MNKLNGLIKTSTCASDESGLCAHCGTVAFNTCNRCGDFYCNQKCQKIDWGRHRYICFPMPTLVQHNDKGIAKENDSKNTNKRNNRISKKDIDYYCYHKSDIKTIKTKFGNGSTVHLLSVINFHHSTMIACIRGVTQTDVDLHSNVLDKINIEGSRMPSVGSKRLVVGDYVIVKYDLKFYRGKICQVVLIKSQKIYHVLLYDIGRFVKREIDELHTITKHILEIAPSSYLVILGSKRNVHIQSPFIEAFLKRNYILKYNENEFDQAIELYDLETKKSLRDIFLIKMNPFETINRGESICNLKDVNIKGSKEDEEEENKSVKLSRSMFANTQGRCKKEEEKGTPVLSPPFQIFYLKKGMKDIKAVVMDTSTIDIGCIGCIESKYFRYVQEVRNKLLHENYDATPPYKPCLYEFCIAKFENEWYRAKVVQISEDNEYHVFYIDFGNVEKLNGIGDIRRYPMNLTIPCNTTICVLQGLPRELNKSHKEYLIENVTNAQSICINEVIDFEQTDITFATIQCDDITKKMEDKGLF